MAREYIWGMYWLRAGEWRADDALDAESPLLAGLLGRATPTPSASARA